jgi:hypothetical protein
MSSVAQTQTVVQFDDALRALAARATERYPGEVRRIEKALLIALNGGVTLFPDGTADVKSQTDAEIIYRVQQAQCDCPDFRRTPHCKHVWARCLVRKAQKMATPKGIKRIAYHATYKGVHGQAIRDEAGIVWFISDDDAVTSLTDSDRPHTQLHGRVDIAAGQRVEDTRKAMFHALAQQNA